MKKICSPLRFSLRISWMRAQVIYFFKKIKTRGCDVSCFSAFPLFLLPITHLIHHHLLFGEVFCHLLWKLKVPLQWTRKFIFWITFSVCFLFNAIWKVTFQMKVLERNGGKIFGVTTLLSFWMFIKSKASLRTEKFASNIYWDNKTRLLVNKTTTGASNNLGLSTNSTLKGLIVTVVNQLTSTIACPLDKYRTIKHAQNFNDKCNQD